MLGLCVKKIGVVIK